jgi:hypothetical protein
METFTKNIKGAMEAVTITFWCWSLGVLVMWGIASWKSIEKNGTVADLPATIVAMIGTGMTGNLVNKFFNLGKEDKQNVQS